jgi:hypothetical protein
MMDTNRTGTDDSFVPPAQHVVALLFLSVGVLLLSLPMFSGAFIASPYNDQFFSGYALREWAAVQTRALGHVPLWNPEMYGGLPFVGAMHGDIFYPTAWLRLILPTVTAMNIGFAVHYVLAGWFMYWFLQVARVRWAGRVTGAFAYQLSGVIGSYVSPGHDGKLFVSTLLPLAILALVVGGRDRRPEGYGLLACTTGLALLSPHPQMVQYYLVATGLFAVYVGMQRLPQDGPSGLVRGLGAALAAVVVGVGISAIQYFPFYAYIPFSPREESVVADFAFSTSYAIPWAHLPELVLQRFAGETFSGTYWGPNGLKLHSEYLGLGVVALGALGMLDRQRRSMVRWLLVIGVLLLLVSLGGATPFYRLWWSVVPFVKSTRAPGMALFAVSFVLATFAAFGVDRLERREGRSPATAWLIVGALVLLFALAGVFEAVAGLLAPVARAPVTTLAASTIRSGALVSGCGLLALAGFAWAWHHRRMPAAVLVLGIPVIAATDLWVNAKTFWNYTDNPQEVYGTDPIKDYLATQSRPMRVWDLLYPGASLMSAGISQWYGHHGNEIHAFDVLNGRVGMDLSFRNQGHPTLMELYAINYVLVPVGAVQDSLPGYERVLNNVTTSIGENGDVFRRRDPFPYARLIPGAITAPLEDAVRTVLDPRFPVRQVVILDDAYAGSVSPLESPLPAAMDAIVQMEFWQPGFMQLAIVGGAPRDAYLLVSESHYKDWKATVDGRDTEVVRGDAALITVPVPAGAREVELRFVSPEYTIGKRITLVSSGVAILALLVPLAMRGRKPRV